MVKFISLISLYRGKIEEANDFTGISQNPEVEFFFELLRARQFDKLRYHIAKLINISVSYYNVIVKKYDFYGSESSIIKLLRNLCISNDIYSSTLQCYSCCDNFTISPQLGSLSNVTSTLQASINDRMIPKQCKKCHSDDCNLEQLSGNFHVIPSILITELGHLHEISCVLKDIDEIIYITDRGQTILCYKLVGFSISLGNHFCLIIRIIDKWYKYDDMLTPKLHNGEKIRV